VFIRLDTAALNHLLITVNRWCGSKVPYILDVYGCLASCSVSLYLQWKSYSEKEAR